VFRGSGPISAKQAQTYYRTEYARGDYYAADGTIPGEWSGELAAELGLSGAVQLEDFHALLDGYLPGHPGDESRRIRGKRTHESRLNKRTGREERTQDRAAHDMVFSPHKSISVAAELYGHGWLVDVVLEANRACLEVAEEHAAAVAADHSKEPTGRLVIASFLHDTSRNLDPQLHVHNVVLNTTRRADGKLVALSEQAMYGAQKLGDAAGQALVARRLRERGFEVGWEKGAAAIVGISPQLLERLSSRRQEIEGELARTGRSGARAAEEAALGTRRAKVRNIDKEALRAGWLKTARELGGLSPIAVDLKPEPMGPEAPAESLRWALEHLSERQATFTQAEVEITALEHAAGLATLPELRAAMAADASLIWAGKGGPSSARQLTTTAALGTERAAVERMRAGLGAGEAVAVSEATLRTRPELSAQQLAAVRHILTTRDQVLAVEGKAGAGKSWAMSDVVENARAAGWTVRGFAPYTGQAENLREMGLGNAKTVAALLHEKPSEQPSARQLWIVDEAGVLGSSDMRRLLDRAASENARVVLVGDRYQHGAVAAGKPFVYLQQAGLAAVRIDEIQRQKVPAKSLVEAAAQARAGNWPGAIAAMERHAANPKARPIPEMKAALALAREGRLDEARGVLEQRAGQAHALADAVLAASDGDARKAIEILSAAGKVHEVADRAERHRLIADDYMRTPEGQSCIVVAPTNAERRDLNRRIREQLVGAGKVQRKSYRASVRVPKGLTTAQKRDARFYAAGDRVSFTRAARAHRIAQGDAGQVLGVDRKTNSVRVELEGGRVITFNPARVEADAATLDTRRLAVGDRIQYREPAIAEGEKVAAGAQRITNGARGTITKIDHTTGQACVELMSGRKVQLDLSKAQPIDLAYCVTSHASQGRTEDRSISTVDSTHPRSVVNREQAYVTKSRAGLEAVVYTDNAARLADAVSREAGKTSALELVQGKERAHEPTQRGRAGAERTDSGGRRKRDLELDVPALPADLAARLAGPARSGDGAAGPDHGAARLDAGDLARRAAAGPRADGAGREAARLDAADSRAAAARPGGEHDRDGGRDTRSDGRDGAGRDARHPGAEPADARAAVRADGHDATAARRAAGDERDLRREREPLGSRLDGAERTRRDEEPGATAPRRGEGRAAAGNGDRSRGAGGSASGGGRGVVRDPAGAREPGHEHGHLRPDAGAMPAEPTAARPQANPQTLDEQLAGLEARIQAATPSPEQQRITDAQQALRGFDDETRSEHLRLRAGGESPHALGRYLSKRSGQREPLAHALAAAKGEKQTVGPDRNAVERSKTQSSSVEIDR
jgi:conjugative relaxase-like TrwC/TraI family protein